MSNFLPRAAVLRLKRTDREQEMDSRSFPGKMGCRDSREGKEEKRVSFTRTHGCLALVRALLRASPPKSNRPQESLFVPTVRSPNPRPSPSVTRQNKGEAPASTPIPSLTSFASSSHAGTPSQTVFANSPFQAASLQECTQRTRCRRRGRTAAR